MKKLMTLVGHPITIAFMMLLTCGLTMEMIYFDYQAIMKTGTHAVANLEVFEETLALWLVGIGVLLEEREVVTNKVYGDDHPPREEFLDHTCLHHGCGILLVGLGIEMIDQLFSMMHRYHIAAPEPFYFTLPLTFWPSSSVAL